MSDHLVVGKGFDGRPPGMHGRPERIFISVDESTGRSTISFQPSDVGPPLLHEGDRTGAVAMSEAKAISERHPGCTIHGPHFHAARTPGRRRMVRRPNNNGSR